MNPRATTAGSTNAETKQSGHGGKKIQFVEHRESIRGGADAAPAGQREGRPGPAEVPPGECVMSGVKTEVRSAQGVRAHGSGESSLARQHTLPVEEKAASRPTETAGAVLPPRKKVLEWPDFERAEQARADYANEIPSQENVKLEQARYEADLKLQEQAQWRRQGRNLPRDVEAAIRQYREWMGSPQFEMYRPLAVPLQTALDALEESATNDIPHLLRQLESILKPVQRGSWERVDVSALNQFARDVSSRGRGSKAQTQPASARTLQDFYRAEEMEASYHGTTPNYLNAEDAFKRHQEELRFEHTQAAAASARPQASRPASRPTSDAEFHPPEYFEAQAKQEAEYSGTGVLPDYEWARKAYERQFERGQDE
ncbi:MAG TPA: hypothetical protein VFP68_10345 [Burkholderiaceae bacterium]|nr:hypothetical protein [Burkholderiaceae bacterium]